MVKLYDRVKLKKTEKDAVIIEIYDEGASCIIQI